MISLTVILLCALAPFIAVFILVRVIIHYTEKLLDFLIEGIFSLPEKIYDSIKEKFENKGKISEAIELEE